MKIKTKILTFCVTKVFFCFICSAQVRRMSNININQSKYRTLEVGGIIFLAILRKQCFFERKVIWDYFSSQAP